MSQSNKETTTYGLSTFIVLLVFAMLLSFVSDAASIAAAAGAFVVLAVTAFKVAKS